MGDPQPPAYYAGGFSLAERRSASPRLRAMRLPPIERYFSKALRLVKHREVDRKSAVLLVGHESGPNPAIDAAKPSSKPAFAAQLCSDNQTHHPAIAHLSPFWPRTQQITRKSHALRPATRTRKRKQGDGGVLTAMRRAPKMPTRTRLCPPYPLSGGKHPRRTERARTASACGNANTRQRHAPERPATRNTSQPQRGCTGG